MFILRCELRAVGKERPRFTRSGVAYTPKKTADFERKVKKLAKEKMELSHHQMYEKSTPLRMTVFFYFAPPKSWSKKKRAEYIEEHYPKTTKCDLTNLTKSIEDAFNGVVYEDDSAISESSTGKYYAERDSFTVFIERLDVEDDFPTEPEAEGEEDDE